MRSEGRTQSFKTGSENILLICFLFKISLRGVAQVESQVANVTQLLSHSNLLCDDPNFGFFHNASVQTSLWGVGEEEKWEISPPYVLEMGLDRLRHHMAVLPRVTFPEHVRAGSNWPSLM